MDLNQFTDSPLLAQMDVDASPHPTKKQTRKARGRKREAIRVVYISSPMKVKTSASKFRSLVQELTGRDSDMARDRIQNLIDNDQVSSTFDHSLSSWVPMMDPSFQESPTSSDSLIESFDDVFATYMNQGYNSMFSSNFSCELPDVGAFGSFDVA